MENLIQLPFHPVEKLIELSFDCESWVYGYLPKTLTTLFDTEGVIPYYEKPFLSIHAKRMPFALPSFAFLSAVAYLLIVWLGIEWMKTRKPVNVHSLSMLHNCFMILLSSYMCLEIFYQAWKSGYSFVGNPLDESNQSWPVARILWLFYMSKLPEFMDTFIMILKKNFRQVSFLHVYHHASILLVTWFGTVTAPSGDSYLSPGLNSFIHVLMYSYYLLSGLKVEWVKRWKHYITRAQILQFIVIGVQNVCGIVYGLVLKKEGYPVFINILLSVYMVTMLALFGNFYVKDRLRRSQATNAKSSKSD